jgi:hypothetical protein
VPDSGVDLVRIRLRLMAVPHVELSRAPDAGLDVAGGLGREDAPGRRSSRA